MPPQIEPAKAIAAVTVVGAVGIIVYYWIKNARTQRKLSENLGEKVDELLRYLDGADSWCTRPEDRGETPLAPRSPGGSSPIDAKEGAPAAAESKRGNGDEQLLD